jgi:DNA ligase-1
VLLRDVVATSNAVANVSGRLDKVSRLADLLSRTAPDEMATVIGFLSGAPRQGRIGIGGSSIAEAHVPPAAAPEPRLTIHDVDAAFDRIARAAGRGSLGDKVRLLRDLLGRATGDEQDFLVRLLFGELRQGALEGVLIDAVARAARLPVAAVRRAAMMAGAIGPVALAAVAEGEAGLSRFMIRMFQPVQPMLAESAESVAEAIQRIGTPAVEYKLDGARIQVHKAGDEVRVYTRNLREVTGAVPEVVEAVRPLPARETILDGEVIALRADRTPHPFQVTMRRFGRKLEGAGLRRELPLTPVLFDCLYMDGEALIDRPQSDRFRILAGLAPALVVPHVIEPTADEAEEFLESALRQGHEGIMAKALDAPYAAGSRGRSWIKVKQARTLDLVVLAAEWGHGRRRGWLSNLHLGARDPERGAFVMLGKTFKGLTDALLEWQTAELLAREISRDAYTVYVKPELVVEIAFNDLQESPHYPGGLALRFARVKRYRPDKTADDADTITDVRDIYRMMTGNDPPTRNS